MTITAKVSIPLKGKRWLAWLLVVGWVDEDDMEGPGVLDITIAAVVVGGASTVVWLLQLLVLQQLDAK